MEEVTSSGDDDEDVDEGAGDCGFFDEGAGDCGFFDEGAGDPGLACCFGDGIHWGQYKISDSSEVELGTTHMAHVAVIFFPRAAWWTEVSFFCSQDCDEFRFKQPLFLAAGISAEFFTEIFSVLTFPEVEMVPG